MVAREAVMLAAARVMVGDWAGDVVEEAIHLAVRARHGPDRARCSPRQAGARRSAAVPARGDR